jgi:hypothetical protein
MTSWKCLTIYGLKIERNSAAASATTIRSNKITDNNLDSD